MKVLVVITGISGGGSERSLEELLPGFVAAGFTVDVAYFVARPDDPTAAIRDLGVRLHHVDARSLPARIVAVRRLVKRIRPDLVHTTLFDADIAGRCATAGSGTPVLTSLVNIGYGPERRADPSIRLWKLRLVKALESGTARRLTTHFHANSQAVADSAVDQLGIPASAISVVPRGRDPRRLGTPSEHSRDAARHALGIDADNRLAVRYRCRLEYQKNHLALVRPPATSSARVPGLQVVHRGASRAWRRLLSREEISCASGARGNCALCSVNHQRRTCYSS